MLSTLYIKNYALIEEITVSLQHGLNIITGETGAGKSIIVDALSLLLGERSSVDTIRKGAERAVVEGVFSGPGLPKLENLLEKNDVELSGDVIMRREVSAKGQSRCFINDSPVTLSLLKEAGDLLVDLHGQHDHQALIRPETHIDFLDEFGGYAELLAEYGVAFKNFTELISEKQKLLAKETVVKAKKDLYEFQIQEIDALNPQEDEEEALEAELKKLENAERLFEVTSQLSTLFYEGETSLHDLLVQARKQLESLHGIDAAFGDSVGEIRSAEIIVDELAKFVQQYHDRIEFNQEKLALLRERLGRLALLKKKYGGTLTALIAHRRMIGEEVALAANFETEIAKIANAIEEARRLCGECARRLTSKRKDASKKISKAVVESMAELGIARPLFEVRIAQDKAEHNSEYYLLSGSSRLRPTARGIDAVEFFLSTNTGEDLKPLIKVASGGEISRVMLALKSALAESDRTPLLIFDEIDVGVSGKVGQAVGRSLKKLASSHQVIAITHLPQIAALADSHYAVEKREENGRTATRLRELKGEERVTEVAKLLSGAEVTDAGLKSARELMETS
jgi:DNA repair protein RecN (Recombination protein N)